MSPLSPMFKDVIAGLTSRPKTLSPKYFYDQRGAFLFNQICKLKEYYPTRTELSILETYIKDIVLALGRRPILYELGSGSSTKIQILLSQMDDIIGYVPIDICPYYLHSAFQELQNRFPQLAITPSCMDFTERFDFSDPLSRAYPHANRVIFFPGTTIGNFTPKEAETFLLRVAHTLSPRGKLLIGVDAVKDTQTLENAYNDSLGITGEFNLNILKRINSELGANSNFSHFRHLAFYNRNLKRIEMHLTCIESHEVIIQGNIISFKAGETIHTESSYKYEPSSFISLAEQTGFQLIQKWNDDRDYFNLFLFEVSAESAANPAA